MDFQVDFGHQRTGGINDAQAPRRGFSADGGGNAVGRENQRRTFGNVSEIICKHCAALTEALDNMFIVDNLMPHIDWRPENLQAFFHNINGPVHPGTKPARTGKECIHAGIIPARLRTEGEKVMQTNAARKTIKLATALLAGTLLTAGTAWAQFGDEMPPAPGGQGGPVGGGPGGPFGGGMPNSPGAGENPFSSAQMPFAMGTVRSVDAATGSFVVTSQFGGEPRTVKITLKTEITARVESQVSDLKVGDTLQVHGVPTGITASTISAGDTSTTSPVMGGMMGEGPFGAGRPNGASGPGGPGTAYAQASGKITALSPLTIALPGDIQVILKTAPNVKISRLITEKIGDLKAGDKVMVNGQPAADGSLAATRVRANDADPSGAGMGGF